MKTRLGTSIAAAALAVGSLVLPASPAAADDAHCYGWDTHPDLYSAGGIHFGNGTYIRRGPYTDCDGLGLGYPSHGIDVHCAVINSNNRIWYYVRDTTTGVNGWALDDSLNFDGLQATRTC